MKLLNEMVNDWEVYALVEELDQVSEQYGSLVKSVQLNETVLDDLPDNLIQKVSEIEHRMKTIEKARDLVDKLKQGGGFTKEQVAKHKSRLYKNRERLRKSMYTAKKKMQELEDQVEDLVKGIDPEEDQDFIS